MTRARLHGSPSRPVRLSADPKEVLRQGQTIRTERRLSLVTDLGADVGAPIIEDKLWLYAGFQWTRTAYDLERSLHLTSYDDDGIPSTDLEPIPGSVETFQATQNMFQGIAKLTWAANSTNRLDLVLNTAYPVSGGDGDYGINPQTGLPEIGTETSSYAVPLNGEYGAIAHEHLGDSINAVLKWSNDISREARLDTWLGWHRERGGRLPSDGSEIGSSSGLAGQSNVWYQLNHSLAEFEDVPECEADTQPDADPSMFVCPINDYRTGGPEFINEQEVNRAQARSIWTQLFEAAGHHVFKAGVNVEGQFYDHVKGYSGGRSVTEEDTDLWLDGAVYGYLTGPDEPVVLSKLENSSESTTFGGFVQDSWEIADLVTLNVGVRYDAQLLFANGDLAMSLMNQISPRVGVVYDPTKDGRAKVFANYGRYYEQVPLVMLDRYLTGEPFLFALRECTEPGVEDGDCFADGALIPHRRRAEPQLHRVGCRHGPGRPRSRGALGGRDRAGRRIRGHGARPSGPHLRQALAEPHDRRHEPRRGQHLLLRQPRPWHRIGLSRGRAQLRRRHRPVHQDLLPDAGSRMRATPCRGCAATTAASSEPKTCSSTRIKTATSI